MKKIFFLIFFVCFNHIISEEKKDSDNGKSDDGFKFVFPLYSFGQNITSKNDLYGFVSTLSRNGNRLSLNKTFVGFLYGISDRFSVIPAVQINSFKINKNKSSGLGDIGVQFEYAFYQKNTPEKRDQATIVANITLPTGSAKKNPPLGFGSPSFFLGLTWRHISHQWYVFTSYGATLTTQKRQTKFGNEYLYEFGIGKKIGKLKGGVVWWLFEMNGVHLQRDKICGQIDPNSGGNFIFWAPMCLRFDYEKLILQFGPQFPVLQKQNGQQNKIIYSFAFSLIWKF
ncbi:hypothetical protein M1446_00450 [Candidatus Dependentiae bacterium]|nr:hypothetical protein [Candidatus Dependentiae bacterium]